MKRKILGLIIGMPLVLAGVYMARTATDGPTETTAGFLAGVSQLWVGGVLALIGSVILLIPILSRSRS